MFWSGLYEPAGGHTLLKIKQTGPECNNVEQQARRTIPCVLNSGADLLSRGNPLYGKWRINPEVLHLMWERFS